MSGAGSTPLVTVITPAYNVAPYLAEAIRSVLAQGEQCFEYLVVDDGSTDETGALIHEAASNDSRVRLLEQEHAGSSARTAGYSYLLSRSAGRRLILWDSLGRSGRSLMVNAKRPVLGVMRRVLKRLARDSSL